jgi:vancomycin resistance protein YoaR
VSQIATTLFNAAFFGGLEIVEHTPHQLYISRYPPGREATISWGGPELVIRNDWNAAVLVSASVASDSLTISLYSQLLGRRVEESTGAPFAQTEPQERDVDNPGLAPGERVQIQPGSPGFSIEVTRKVFRGDELVRDEVFQTTYSPDAILFAVGPGTPPEPEQPEEPTTDAPTETSPATTSP